MKRLLYIASFIALLVGTQATAGDAHLFDLDEGQIVAELADLTELENFVSENEGVTLSMLNEGEDFTGSLSLDALDALSALNLFEPPLGIPSFLWGFCFGVIGILITYLVTDSKDETKKALLGCAVAAVAGFLIWLIAFVLLASTAAAATTI